jgi:hypothetical protein
MDIFHAHDRDDLPWMSRASANDPEKIIEITEKIREPVEVYSWFSRGNWVCVSINQISQCIDGNFNFVQFGANAINNVTDRSDGLIISGIFFRMPEELIEIYRKLVNDVELFAFTE